MEGQRPTMAGYGQRTCDVAHAREWYRRFLDRWKDTDPDLALLREAKAEAARLGAQPRTSRRARRHSHRPILGASTRR